MKKYCQTSSPHAILQNAVREETVYRDKPNPFRFLAFLSWVLWLTLKNIQPVLQKPTVCGAQVSRAHRNRARLHALSKYNVEAVKFLRCKEENKCWEKGHFVTATADQQIVLMLSRVLAGFTRSLTRGLDTAGASSWLIIWTHWLAPTTAHLELVRQLQVVFFKLIGLGPFVWCNLFKHSFAMNESRR